MMMFILWKNMSEQKKVDPFVVDIKRLHNEINMLANHELVKDYTIEFSPLKGFYYKRKSKCPWGGTDRGWFDDDADEVTPLIDYITRNRRR